MRSLADDRGSGRASKEIAGRWVCGMAFVVAALSVGCAAPSLASEGDWPQEERESPTQEGETQARGGTGRPKKPWNVIDTSAFTIGLMAGIVLDRTGYEQDAGNRAHIGDLSAFDSGEVRGVRLGVVGQIKFDNPWTYMIGGANRAFDKGFDTTTDEIFTLFDYSVHIPMPSNTTLSLGKFKEPMSHERLLGLIFNPAMERSSAADSLLTARNVGIQIASTEKNQRMSWAVGVFNDWFDQNESFDRSSTGFTGRLTGLPYVSKADNELVHVGIGTKYSNGKDRVARLTGTVESYFAPAFLDTGAVPYEGAGWLSLETSWARGPLWLSAEHLSTKIDSPSTGNPVFDGYHLMVSFALTGESRGYDRRLGVFRRPIPAVDVRNEGRGMIDIYSRFSRIDLSSSGVNGGEIDQMTLGLSWHPTADTRVQIQYSYADIENAAGDSDLQFLQMRWWMIL